MVDFYKLLGIKPAATTAEVKSAYRRLARQRHPDVNGGSPQAAREFALIALAYRTLSDPQERAYYDAKLNQRMAWESGWSSVMHSNNPHARRMRMAATQARWDKRFDRWLEAERRETFALQQAVFTTVTFFFSTFIVAMFKPRFWQSMNWVGRAILLTLFLIGLWHLASRLRTYFERYTYQPRTIHDSIINGDEKAKKPFTRATAILFLMVGCFLSLVAGLFAGAYVNNLASDMSIFFNHGSMIFFFDRQIRLDLLFYPPIAVLIVDLLHSVASKID